jgi:hypothetical protein
VCIRMPCSAACGEAAKVCKSAPISWRLAKIEVFLTVHQYYSLHVNSYSLSTMGGWD